MERYEIDVHTGTRKVIQLTAKEIQADLDEAAKNDADRLASLDTRASAAIDSIDRLQFTHLFDLENRVRALEGKATITSAQYRQALIDKWKTLNE